MKMLTIKTTTDEDADDKDNRRQGKRLTMRLKTRTITDEKTDDNDND